jgi:hypothetical protein
LGGSVVLLMAAHAFRGSVCIVTGGMALGAILYIVAFGEREEIVVDAPAIPAKSHGVVAFRAIRGKACHLMVGALGCRIVVLVATDAVITQAVKPQVAGIVMAFHTTEVAVGTYEGEPVFFVYFRHIRNQPVLGGVAADAIIPNRLAVYVRVAGGAVHWRFIEYKGAVAKFAVGLGMCAFEREFGFIVVKLKGIVVYCPTRRVVAFHTVHFQLVPVGGLP